MHWGSRSTREARLAPGQAVVARCARGAATISERTDRWHRVEQICQNALDLPVADRAAFLEAACPRIRSCGTRWTPC